MNHPQTIAELPLISDLAAELKGSEIIKLAAEIKEKLAQGAIIDNYTIGDFDPKIFPIPSALKTAIIEAYHADLTNYPASNGMEQLRHALKGYIRESEGLDYASDEFLIAAGGRPLIYAAYQAILNPDEPAVYPVPSWNNNHYTTLSRGSDIAVPTKAENRFMPTAAELSAHLADAGMVALCSPLNPTGTVFTREALTEICELILAENKAREGKRKPLYLLYDQIYWQLMMDGNTHYHPVGIFPEMKPYTIYVDGISKAFAATGVRVGWAFGPRLVIDKMKSILGHIGAWSPKPEQLGTAAFLEQKEDVASYLTELKIELKNRLNGFYTVLKELKNKNLPVDVIAPEAAIYLTVKFDLVGKIKANGEKINSVADTTRFLLDEAGIALVPFTAFGASAESPWYRLSIGTSKMSDIARVSQNLERALTSLS